MSDPLYALGGVLLERANRISARPIHTAQQTDPIEQGLLFTRKLPGDRAPRQFTFTFDARTMTGGMARALRQFVRQYAGGKPFTIHYRGQDVSLVLLPDTFQQSLANGLRSTTSVDCLEALATD